MDASVITHTLATFRAYLRVDEATGRAEIISGAQVDYLLTQLHPADTVQSGPHGAWTVTPAPGAAPLHYLPLTPRMLPDARHYMHFTGAVQEPLGPVTGFRMRQQLRTAPGTIHTLTDGTRVHLHHGRVTARWIPIPQETL